MTEHRHIVIIGAGFGGIGLVIKLREAGFHDLLVLEQADDVGGTWQHNTYPGCACDVPSHLYSFSFEPKPDWSRIYGRRDEILDYARTVAARHDVARDVRFGCEVLGAQWDEDTRRWQVDTSRGPVTADILISARSTRVCPAWTPSPARPCTASAGTTTTTWPESGWRS